MNARTSRRVVSGVAVAGILVLGGAGYALRDSLVEQWHIRKLRSEDYTERFSAAERLGGMRSRKAVPGLVALLAESREHAVEAGKVWGPGANPCLSMSAVLEEIGPSAVPFIARALEESDGRREYWRRCACDALAKIGGECAREALIARVNDTDGCVALSAIQRLRAMGSSASDAGPALKIALLSRKAYIRKAASDAMEAIRDSGPKTTER